MAKVSGKRNTVTRGGTSNLPGHPEETDKQSQSVLKRLQSITTVQARNLPDIIFGVTDQISLITVVEMVDTDLKNSRERDDFERRVNGRRKRKLVEWRGVLLIPCLISMQFLSAIVSFLETKLQASIFPESLRSTE